MTAPRRRFSAGCFVLGLLIVTSLTRLPAAWAGGVGTCPSSAQNDYCIQHQVRPSNDRQASSSRGAVGHTHSGPTATPPPCGWVTVDATIAAPWVATGAVDNGAPPPNVPVTWQAWCLNDPSAGASYGGPFRWVAAAAAAPVVTPARVAAGLYEELQGRMPTPVVVTNPPIGTASIVGVPVFVSVANWRSPITVTRSLAGIPVTVSATPQLLFDSGEPGAGSQLCTGPGKRFAAGGGDLSAQASARDACTHSYAHRTGADGRPVVWPGTVTVRWTIAWVSGDGGSGAFPVVNRTIAVPRSVDEVQTVVVAGGRP